MAYAELSLNQGTTFSAALTLSKDDGTSLNVANAVFTCQIRKSYYSANATANLVVTKANSANGDIVLSLDAASTANIKPGRYLYDLKMEQSNTINRVIEGVITIMPQVSR
jgi:hypothetical protein